MLVLQRLKCESVTWEGGEPPERDGHHARGRAVRKEARGGGFAQVARVEFSPDNYDPSKLCMLASVAGDGTLCTLEASYLGVARLGGILGSQRRIKGFDNFFLMTPLLYITMTISITLTGTW